MREACSTRPSSSTAPSKAASHLGPVQDGLPSRPRPCGLPSRPSSSNGLPSRLQSSSDCSQLHPITVPDSAPLRPDTLARPQKSPGLILCLDGLVHGWLQAYLGLAPVLPDLPAPAPAIGHDCYGLPVLVHACALCSHAWVLGFPSQHEAIQVAPGFQSCPDPNSGSSTTALSSTAKTSSAVLPQAFPSHPAPSTASPCHSAFSTAPSATASSAPVYSGLRLRPFRSYGWWA